MLSMFLLSSLLRCSSWALSYSIAMLLSRSRRLLLMVRCVGRIISINFLMSSPSSVMWSPHDCTPLVCGVLSCNAGDDDPARVGFSTFVGNLQILWASACFVLLSNVANSYFFINVAVIIVFDVVISRFGFHSFLTDFSKFHHISYNQHRTEVLLETPLAWRDRCVDREADTQNLIHSWSFRYK